MPVTTRGISDPSSQRICARRFPTDRLGSNGGYGRRSIRHRAGIWTTTGRSAPAAAARTARRAPRRTRVEAACVESVGREEGRRAPRAICRVEGTAANAKASRLGLALVRSEEDGGSDANQKQRHISSIDLSHVYFCGSGGVPELPCDPLGPLTRPLPLGRPRLRFGGCSAPSATPTPSVPVAA